MVLRGGQPLGGIFHGGILSLPLEYPIDSLRVKNATRQKGMTMYFEKRHIREATVLDCFGKFCEEDHDRFMETLESLHKEGCRYLVVNLTSVYQISESISGLFKFAHEYFSVDDGHIGLVSPLSSVRQTLDRAEVSSLIPTYLTVYDSLHRRQAILNKSLTLNGSSPDPAHPMNEEEAPRSQNKQTADNMVGVTE